MDLDVSTMKVLSMKCSVRLEEHDLFKTSAFTDETISFAGSTWYGNVIIQRQIVLKLQYH